MTNEPMNHEHLKGGPGWVLLTHNRRGGKLQNYFVAEHHLGMPIDQDLLRVLDNWEHALHGGFRNQAP
jgi:superoxide dismutase